MKTLIFALLILISGIVSSRADTLAWCASTSTNITNYVVYYTTAANIVSNSTPGYVTNKTINGKVIGWSGDVYDTNIPCPPTLITSGTNWFRIYYNHYNAGNKTSAVLTNLIPGMTYYFSVTAQDNTGHESGWANEIEYTVPKLPSTPQNLRVFKVN